MFHALGQVESFAISTQTVHWVSEGPVLTLPELGFVLRMTPVWSGGDEKDRSDNGLLGILRNM